MRAYTLTFVNADCGVVSTMIETPSLAAPIVPPKHAFVVAPAGAEWAQDRTALWNAAEAAEKRKDAKVVRFEVVAVHEPGREGDQRNWHAHVLTTTREVSAGGMGAKTRALDVKQTSGPAIEQLRELWGHEVNQALERAQVADRVDHRSFARRGERTGPWSGGANRG